MLNNLGGATPPYFRGPRGQYRFGNIHTVEPQEVCDHRLRALRGGQFREAGRADFKYDTLGSGAEKRLSARDRLVERVTSKG